MQKPDDHQSLEKSLQLIQLLAKMLSEQEKQNINGTMNLYEINRISHLENYHSNILAFLLDRRQKHHHVEFGELFIQHINEKYLNNSLPPYPIQSIIREQATHTGRRIDILLETASYVIIIENKIYADDQERQLIDYYQWGVTHFPRKRILIGYLTIDGSEPSDSSLPKADRIEMEKNGRYFQLSYTDDILDWLQILQVKPEEVILYSALTQYVDLVKGLCLLREENFMELKSTITSMEVICKNATKEELKQVQKNTQLIEQSCNYYLYTNFLAELGKNISEEKEMRNKSFSVFYTHRQKRYALENKEDWEKAISRDFEYFGLELALGESEGIGIELDKLTSKPMIILGIMMHGTQKIEKYHLQPSWEPEYSINHENTEWWKEYVDVNFIIKNLFNPADTHPNIPMIASWLIEEWDYNKALEMIE